ncbi:MAG: SIMPL domain-containing protein [Halobacteriales archaeon]|nr:SIMPL domain-containing protein [Halobacteriales archaeon]
MRYSPHTLAVIGLGFLVVLAGCSAIDGTGSQAPMTESTPQTGQRLIEVGASGSLQASPDRAVLRVGVRASGQNAATARQRLAANVSRMRSALKRMGIGRDQITTVYFDIDRDYRRFREADDRQPIFTARHTFLITLTDLNRTGSVIVTAVENGATSVDDVRFVVSKRTRKELRDKAIARAMADARRQANVIAARSNLSVTGVSQVRTGHVGFDSGRERQVAATATPVAASAPTDIDTGTVTVSARVTVVYNATTRRS